MDITLKQMRYSTVLARELSFRKAAEACFISQPALSEQIHLLEETLGVQLFERTRRSVQITPSGKRFLEEAARILTEVETLVIQTQSRGKPFALPIALGAIPTIAPYYFPSVLSQLRRSIPELKLYLREEPTDHLLDRLRDGSLDMAMLAVTFDPHGYELTSIQKENFVAIMNKEHPLAKKKRLTIKDISSESILLLDDEHCLSRQTMDVCQLAGAKANQEYRASSMNTLVQMVANGLGITLVPESAIELEVRHNKSLIPVAFSSPPGRELCLAWRKGAARQKEYTLLAKQIITIIHDRQTGK